MRETYLPRAIEPVLRRAAREFPVVVLTGPRQAGKTTVLRRLFGREYRYASVELPDVRAAAQEDPRGFLASYPPPVILDEIQHAPQLLPYIKERVDADRHRAGAYLLTGSQNLLLLQQVTESLPGRSAMLRLLPLSLREARGRLEAPLPWEARAAPPSKPLAHRELWAALLRGGYPELAAQPGRQLDLWHGSYVQTYLERDVRMVRQVGDLSQFQSFLRLLAARSGQLLHLSGLARDLGVAVNTLKAWLSVLEATYQVVVLRPYFANVGKRLVKTPKVYFTDTGTLCYLCGLRDPAHAAAGPLAGAILETAVLSEIVKTLVHRGEEPRVYFWRTAAGMEVDFVVEAGERLVPLEVKLSGTPRPSMASPVKALLSDLGGRAGPGFVIHPGDVRLPLGEGVTALPLGAL
jgi:predicted AAA+ superfamily ATPase